MFQRTGSYKLRGPLNKLALLTDEERTRGVVCSSAGNHAQGVALAAAIYGIRAVVVMAENATPSKIEATRGYGADVVLHGTVWDEANEKAQELVEHGLLEVLCGQLGRGHMSSNGPGGSTIPRRFGPRRRPTTRPAPTSR